MADPVETARTTLEGRVNDWPEMARRNADAVLRLVEEHADVLASAHAHAAVADSHKEMAEAVRDTAVETAAAAASDATRARLERDAARAELGHVKALAAQLLGRIVEDSHGHRLAEGSAPQVRKLAEAANA